MSLAFVDRFVLSLLVDPIKRDLHISDVQIGLLQAIPFGIFYTMFGLPLGRIADNANRRNLLGICVLVWSAFTALCALAQSYWLLFFSRIGVASGEAGLPPTTMSIISDYFPKEKRTKPFGLFMCGAHIGGGGALILGGAVLGAIMSSDGVTLPILGNVEAWRVTFLLAAAPGFLLGLIFFTVREPERREAAQRYGFSGVIAFLVENWRSYGAIFVGVSLIGACGAAIMAWAPTMFMRVKGIPHANIGLGLGTAVLIGGVSGALLCGVFEELLRRRGDRNPKVTLITVCGLLLPICVVIAIHAEFALLSFILFGFGFMFLAMPLVLAPAAIMAITPGRIRGQSGAIYIIFTGIIGGVLGPMLVPLLSDFLFASETAIGRALAYVVAVCAPLGAAIVFSGRTAITAQAEDY